MTAPRASQDRYWKEQAELFLRYYRAAGAWSLRAWVTRFLTARSARLAALAVFPADARVLDLGCGSGAHLRELAAGGRRVVGTDYSEPMLRAAQRESGASSLRGLVLADAHALPFAAGSFDALVTMGLLDYVGSPARVLAECRRVLRPGATLVASAPKTPSAFAWLRTGVGNRVKHTLFDLPPILNVWDRGGLEQLLREAGFTLNALASVWTTMWIARARVPPR